MKIVKDLRTLKAMERRGLVTLHPDTGKVLRHPMGGKIRCWYVDEAEFIFEYKGERYMRKFFDGCFFPFIVKLEKE
jgi:hypothetical protein